jgi:cation transport regulator ChaB
MSSIKLFFTFFIVCFSVIKLNAQSIHNDSLLMNHIHGVSNYLGLSGVQELQFIQVEKNQLNFGDSLAKQNLTPEIRNKWVSNQLKQHDKQLKALFTSAQWKKYNDFLEDRRNEFLQRSANKKVKIKEVDRTN